MGTPMICLNCKLSKLKNAVTKQKISGQFQRSFIKCCFKLIISQCCTKFCYISQFFLPPLTHTLIGSHIVFFSLLRGIFLQRVEKSDFVTEKALFLPLIFLIGSITGWLICTEQNDLMPRKFCISLYRSFNTTVPALDKGLTKVYCIMCQYSH